MSKKRVLIIKIGRLSFKISMKRLKAIEKYTILTACGFILFKIGQAAAFKQRGYSAYGGEYLLLGLPIFYYLISSTVRNHANEIKKLLKGV